MSFSPKTRNFQLQNLTRNENVLFTLIIKQKVKVVRTEGSISVLTESNQELGTLDIISLEDYHPNVEFEGFVRSIVRAPDRSISTVFVSLTPRKRPQDPQWVPRWETETQQEGWLLRQQHYEALVANERIRTQLENQELQRILKSVDLAENRETALHEAHEGTEMMRKFLQEILTVLNIEQFSPSQQTTTETETKF